MKPSRYNVFAVEGDCVHAVNLLSRSVMDLSPEAYATYQRLVEAAIDGPLSDHEDSGLAAYVDALRGGLFLLDDDFDELAYIRLRSRQERFSTRQLGVVITPTLKCNFGCHYCFEQKQDASLDGAGQARLLRLVASHLPGREHLSVQWFGGEPLLALDAIEELSSGFLRLAEATGATYLATVITNGMLMTDAVSARLAAHGVGVAQLTLDGDRELHDRTRRETAASGSFDTILDNIRGASSRMQVKVRAHVGPFNVASVHRLIDTLHAEDMSAHVHELYFAPLFNYRAGDTTGRAYLPDGKRFMTAEAFARVQIELLDHAMRMGFHTADWLDASYGICTAVRSDTLVVDPAGHLHKCYKDVGEPDQAIGDLVSGPQVGPNLLKWMDIELPRDAECRDCRVLPVCLGGCSKQWMESAPKDVICSPLRFNLDARLALYARSLAANTVAPRVDGDGGCSHPD